MSTVPSRHVRCPEPSVRAGGFILPMTTAFFLVVSVAGCISQAPTSPDEPSGQVTPRVPGVPAASHPVTDLSVSASGSTATLSFTEVSGADGSAADYLVRFERAPLAWSSAVPVTDGTCAGRLEGAEVGARRTCTVSNLSAGATYEFQMITFTGEEGTEIDENLSNVEQVTIRATSDGSTFAALTFENYASTEDLRASDEDFMGGSEDLNVNKIFLDKDAGYDGLTRSMRYDWVDQGTGSVSIGRGVMLPEPRTELWVELAIKWSSNFTTCNPADPPCDHKTFFLQVWPDLNGRWEVHFGGGGAAGPTAWITMNGPKGDKEAADFGSTGRAANDYFDDQWHVVRLHVRHSTDVNSRNGLMELWVDGELLKKVTNFSTNDGTQVRAILLGRNKDKGLDSGTESMWIGGVKAWDFDPGW